ncbi:MAG TPA: diacylglycerol kinase family protein [Candidatus Saccharimonadales bacterium]|nr:diacylglycerol kinase family protein [Candidatus Saccharimonadales bacterium]
MYYYVLNPAAGKGAVNQIQDKLRDRLRELGIDGEFAKTTGPGDATKMTKLAIEKGHTTVVVVGGDGTVNEVVNGVTQENVAIGVIPIGNSNLLAQRLGITSWQQACEALAARRITSYGLIAAGQKYFLSTLTLGFETELDKQVEAPAGGGLGDRLGQLWQAHGHAQNYQSLECKIVVDGGLELTAPLFSLSITNQKFEDPLADNRLLVTLVDRPPSGRQLTSYLWRLLKKDEVYEGVSRFGAKRLVIETTPPTGLMIDGKVSGRTPIAIRLTNKQIRFITEKQTVSFKTDE